MQHKEITIPAMLRELHGEKARISTLIMTYSAALIAAAVMVYAAGNLRLALWKILLMALVTADVAGGVVANLSSSSSQYYQQKKQLRPVFLLLHVIQPGLMVLVFPGQWLYLAVVCVFTLGSALFLNTVKTVELQQNLAALIVVCGILLSLVFQPVSGILTVFAALYLTKLILGFSVRRPSFQAGH